MYMFERIKAQGDQIRRIFAHCVSVYFGSFFVNYLCK
jgi:hypothetical protein